MILQKIIPRNKSILFSSFYYNNYDGNNGLVADIMSNKGYLLESPSYSGYIIFRVLSVININKRLTLKRFIKHYYKNDKIPVDCSCRYVDKKTFDFEITQEYEISENLFNEMIKYYKKCYNI